MVARLAFSCYVFAALPHHRYRAPAFNGVVENEFCPVYVARAASEPRPNPREVADFAWVRWSDFVAAARGDVDDTYSWWCKNQVRELTERRLLVGLARTANGRRRDDAAVGSHGAAGER